MAVTDFLDVMVFFVFGVAVSSLFSTAVNQELIMPLALNDWIATGSMMGLAAILSLCSTPMHLSRQLFSIPSSGKLAFLAFGPMFDLKLLFIYSAVFRKRFVIGLAVALFILIGLICVRLRIPRAMSASLDRYLSAGVLTIWGVMLAYFFSPAGCLIPSASLIST